MTAPPSMRPEDYADAVVTDTDGRLVVTWPDGRPQWCAATPELVEEWAATVNALRAERDRYRKALEGIARAYPPVGNSAGASAGDLAREALGPAREETT